MRNIANSGAMSEQTAMTGATPGAQNIIGGGLSPLGGSVLSPGIVAGATGGPTDLSTPNGATPAVTHGNSFLEKLVHAFLPTGKGLLPPKSTAKPKTSGPAATPAAPPTPPSASSPNPTTKPLIDPMAMKLFFSSVIGPYLDQIVQEQNASADQLGAQMNDALTNFSIPENVRGLLKAQTAQAQADIRNVGQTQRGAAAAAPDLAAFMAQLQSSSQQQELARLEQQRVLAAQSTANGTAATDPAIQAIIDSLSGKVPGA